MKSPDKWSKIEDDFIRQHNRTISALARRYANRHVSYDDLWVAGALAAWKCGREYDPGKGSLESRIYARVRGAMLDELREWSHLSRRHLQSLSPAQRVEALPRFVDADFALALPTDEMAPDDFADWLRKQARLNEVVAKVLTPRELSIVNLLMQGMSQSEVGTELCIFQSYVSVCMNRIREKLTAAMVDLTSVKPLC